MAWSSKTQATPANIRKRIDAANEAIAGARELMARRNDMKESDRSLSNAMAWLRQARNETMNRRPK